MTRLAALASLTIGVPLGLHAQGVMIAPHQVFMDHRTRSTSMTLYNPNNTPAEITITTFFGYPGTDSTGEFELRTPESRDSTQPSAAEWIEAFPRRLTLYPQEKQIIRLLARPPAGLADGEYWSRIAVSAKGGAVAVAGIDTTKINVGLNLEVRTILPLQYRKGRLQTGVTLSDISAKTIGDSLEVRGKFVRQGSAAFLGTVRGTLVNDAGQIVARFSNPIAVYLDIAPRFRCGIAGLPPGRYVLHVEVTSDREDLPAESVLPIKPVRDSIAVVLPSER